MGSPRSLLRSRRLRLFPAGLVVVLLAGTLSACAPASDRCLPARLDASPAQVSAGETITVASAAAECDLGYDDGATYSVVIISSSGDRSDAVDVPVKEDGRFSVELAVPESFPSGPASVVVSGSTYDDCGEESGSCAVYSADITVAD